MKNTFQYALKSGLVCLSMLVILSMTTAAQNVNPLANFSGSWVVNLPKSDFGDNPPYVAPKKAAIKVSKNEIVFDLSVTSNSGADSTMQVKFPANSASMDMVTAEKRQRHYTVVRKETDSTIVVDYSSSFAGDPSKEEYHTTENWKLTSVNQLTLKKSVAVTGGYSYAVTVVYDKQ